MEWIGKIVILVLKRRERVVVERDGVVESERRSEREREKKKQTVKKS